MKMKMSVRKPLALVASGLFLYALNLHGQSAPGITTQPQGQFATNGQPAGFSVGASGASPLHYQWQWNGVALAGATSSSLALTAVTNAGNITVVVTNSAGSVTSSVAGLVLIAPRALAVLHTFGSVGDGACPDGLVSSSNLLYGTTYSGGIYDGGSVFAVYPDGTDYTLPYQFTGGTDGGNPQIGLAIGDIWNGNSAIYGTAASGGAGGGTVFAVNGSHSGQLSGLKELTGVLGWGGGVVNSVFGFNYSALHIQFDVLDGFTGGSDGAGPQGGLIESGATFYGTTGQGGSSGYGTVYAVNDDASGFSTLYSFTNGVDGASPEAGLILAGTTLYGTTSSGGANALGTVFSINANGSGFKALHTFTGGGDGASPQAGLVLGRNVLYGTTSYGGASGCGTVFAVHTDGTGFKTLYAFSGGLDGANPEAGLTLAGDTLYGTARFGGNNNNGTVFSLATNGGLIVLYAFTGGADGANPPQSGLIVSGNTLYGVAQGGGANLAGTLFRLSPLVEIIQQPAGATVSSGSAASLTVVAAGVPPLAYQWWFNSSAIAGATNASLTLAAAGANNTGSYMVVATNAYGSATSSNGVLTVISGLPSIAAQPASAVAGLGQPAQFGVTAYGTWPLGYQWQFNGGALAGANGSTLSIPSAAATNAGSYSVIISNDFGAVTSSVAALAVYSAPAITVQPQGVMVLNGLPAEFAVSVCGAMPLGWQWFLNGSALDGGTNTMLSVPDVTSSDAGSYTVVVSNAYGSVTSSIAALTIDLPPTILVPPQNLVANAGETAAFSVSACGTAPLSYTWLCNGVPLAGATNSVLTLQVSTNSPGNYSVVVTNNCGSAASSAAMLLVEEPLACTVLHPFGVGWDGNGPNCGLVLGGGLLYGTTTEGGTNNAGTVFSASTSGGNCTVLYSFTGGADGANPYGHLVLSGNTLYGTASGGGANGNGSVFAIHTNGTGFTVLHSFNGDDGASPLAGLVLSGLTLYGTTSEGGTNYSGEVFSVGTNGAGFNVLYNFSGGADGNDPTGELIVAGTTLYGTTQSGGVNGVGNIFSVSTNGAVFSNLYSFTDGGIPSAGLVLSGLTLYGTTADGGTNYSGDVFSIGTSGNGYKVLYNFTGDADGSSPCCSLVLSASSLFGTTTGGGTNYDGTVFLVSTSGTGFKVLHNFTGGTDDSDPQAGLLLSGTTLYGTAQGGQISQGAIFSLSTSGTGFKVLYDFTQGLDGGNPEAGPILSGGTLYGAAPNVVYSVEASGIGYKALYLFTNGEDGDDPFYSLVQSGSTLYGTCYDGGSNGYGTVYSIATNGTGFKVLHTFADGNDGATPCSGLLLSGSTLYGATMSGGTNGAGTIFSVSTSGTAFKTVYAFTGGTDGGSPSGLILSGTTLYGTTAGGGDNYSGNVFAVKTAGTGFTNVYSFTGGADGSLPSAGLTLSGNTLFGTACNGGSNIMSADGLAGWGTIYSVLTSGAGFKVLHTFTGGADGGNPQSALFLSGQTLYGTTCYAGDQGGGGTVFMVNTNTDCLTTLYGFTGGPDGSNPNSVLESGNTLYGTSYGGGYLYGGTVFSLSFAPAITTQPVSLAVSNGTAAGFMVAAAGVAPLHYQWQFNGVSIPGSTNTVVDLSYVVDSNSGNYTVVVTNFYGSVTSSVAVLTVAPPPIVPPGQPPLIGVQPLSLTVSNGQPAQFGVTAYGASQYQWFWNGAGLAGDTNSILSFSAVAAASAGNYTVVAANASGSVTSTVAVLTIVVPPLLPRVAGVIRSAPAITAQPNSLTVLNTQSALLQVQASGTAPLSYQWSCNGRNLAGAAASTLSLPVVTTNSAGSYSVVVANGLGSVTSAVAVLTVTVASTPPQIITSDGFFGFLTNQFGFNVSGTTGQSIVVDGSTDLVNWTPLCTNAAGGNPFYFCDPCWTNFPGRFYRARVQ